MILFKPLVKARARHISALLILLGLFMIALGVYFAFFQTRGYEKGTAVITHVEEEEDPSSDNPDARIYHGTITYTVNGREYVEPLDSWSPGYALGKEIKIKYDPNDPARVYADSPGFAVYLIVAGLAVTAFFGFGAVKNAAQKRELEEEKPAGPLFGAPQRGAAERKLYFLTDQGTAKGGCHIEDENRNVVYEAVCTKFSLVADSQFQFIDHVLDRRTTHLVGKTATSTSDSIFVLDSHSTFDLDGKDIWKLLHANGIRIETGLDGLKWGYTIYRDEIEIARVVSCNRLVHEEDAEAKGVLAKIPFPGFFRIRTSDENLDAVFLTVFAIGRTDMMIYN